MSWVLKEKEISALLVAEGKRRYEYFIHRVCDTEQIWGLYDGGWAHMGDGENKFLPLWPHEEYARRFALGEWSSYQPQEIELHEFLQDWLSDLTAKGVGVAIFPTAFAGAVTVSLADLEAHLRHELAEYYGEEE